MWQVAAMLGTQLLMDKMKQQQAQQQAQQQEAVAGINKAVNEGQGGQDPLASLMGVYKDDEDVKRLSGGF